MIQAIGLTSVPRRGRRPAVDDVTFEAPAGRVTALLGPCGAGKSTALRLLLQLEPGRGVALFDGRPLHRLEHPGQEVGVLLGDVPGHPGRTARNHLRMLAAAAGVPAERADEMLEIVGLGVLAEERVGAFSLGMDRRLGMAAAMLGDPHTLVLDEPAQGLSPREAGWLHGLLRGYAAQGGAVLVTLRDPREAVRVADRVVSLAEGRLLADQEAEDFARTRLRPRVAVSTPHAGRLADLLVQQARSAPRTGADGRERDEMEVVAESGTRLCVYNSDCASVGETAYRHGILVHRLAEESGDDGASVVTARAERAAPGSPTAPAAAERAALAPPRQRTVVPRRSEGPRLHSIAPPGPASPLRYEVRRMLSVRTPWCVLGCVLAVALTAGLGLALAGPDPDSDEALLRLLAGWPATFLFPLPPAAAGAGLLGALAYGQECRYPSLVPAGASVPRRLGLLLAKVAVTAAGSLVLCLAVLAVNGAALLLLFGGEVLVPSDGLRGLLAAVAWSVVLAVGCGWAGLLAAGAARSTAVGLAAVLAVPLLMVPMAKRMFPGGDGPVLDGLAGRLEGALLSPWPSGVDGWVPVAVRLVSQPVGQALAMSLTVLLAAYLLLGLRGRPS
ncbi:ATP-binding cassette domain-containing protein [Streptomyces sp. RKND-216]|uniref:ABC transporter ATP-binding protein n=1 Tax=Streptomyces sp. RKND-216 TaxID=2562581 RepID=UPI00109DD1BB|nr:ATP-binding cassette domain-containing protein [Streptomyces sp. RKND-216]THA24142.1 ATP-binding cassette domain-containing protein [Streptomyces sp. RKND-216]